MRQILNQTGFYLLLAIAVTACVNQNGKTSKGQPLSPGEISETVSAALLSRTALWGHRYYQMDSNHSCQTDEGSKKVPYRRAIELTPDRQVIDLGDPCQPKSEALPKAGALEVAADGSLIGYFDAIFQREGTAMVEAWCNRSLVEESGEVMPIDLRVLSRGGESLLTWAAVNEDSVSTLFEDLKMLLSLSASSRSYVGTEGNASRLDIQLRADSTKQGLFPATYRVGEEGVAMSLYCRLAR